MLYEALRAGMASESELSVVRFVDSLDLDPADLHDQYVGEVMIGSMFAAVLSAERSTWKWMAEHISKGMVDEFLLHLREQGASAVQIAEWGEVVESRFGGYRDCMEGYEGFEPPWKLGRQFYWNISGSQQYVAMSIKISTYYLLEAQNVAQKLVNQYGPALSLNFTR
jgi:hypothetical protein